MIIFVHCWCVCRHLLQVLILEGASPRHKSMARNALGQMWLKSNFQIFPHFLKSLGLERKSFWPCPHNIALAWLPSVSSEPRVGELRIHPGVQCPEWTKVGMRLPSCSSSYSTSSALNLPFVGSGVSYHSLAIYLLHLASYKAIVTHSTGLRSQTGGIRSSVSVALLPPNKEKAALCVHTETGSSWP